MSERRELNNGYLEFQHNDTNVWISGAEANSAPELIGLYKEIRRILDDEFPEHKVQWFIDASNEKLLEAFINSSSFEIEYVSFTMKR